MIHRNKNVILDHILLTTIAILLFLLGIDLMPKINPNFSGLPKVTRQEAAVVADSLVNELGFDSSSFYRFSWYTRDANVLDYLMRCYGVRETMEILQKESIPSAWWNFTWHRNRPKDAQEEFLTIRIRPDGTLLGFRHRVPDSLSGIRLSQEEAISLARSALQRWLGEQATQNYVLEDFKTHNKPNRRDYDLKFVRKDRQIAEGREVIDIVIAGSELVGLMPKFAVPPDFTASSGLFGGTNILFNGLSVVTYFVLTLIALLAFLKKYHAGLISINQGAIAGAVVYFCFLALYLNNWGNFGVGTRIGAISEIYVKYIVLGIQLTTTLVFIFVNIFTSWNAGLHEIRQLKPRLLSGIDSLIKRRWISKNIGREMPTGFIFGMIIFGTTLLCELLIIELFGSHPRIGQQWPGLFSGYLPLFSVLGTALVTTLFNNSVFRAFLIPYVVRLKNSPALAIIISAASYAAYSIFFDEYWIYWPVYFSIIPAFVAGLLLGYVFWHYGLLAALMSSMTLTVLRLTGPLLASQVPFFALNGLLALALLLIIVIIGIRGLFYGKEYAVKLSDEPAHIRRIKEQTRMQQELEIAKKVQLNLLPRGVPRLTGYDIHAACIPALEVGGDYYDFFHLNGNKLGIAIADVSGKGVPAAIYMTLTKGILQSHAENEQSPKTVLTRVNSQMYQTIERSWFVSMFYAVLEPETRQLHFARAGHNPVVWIHRDGSCELLDPPGIGLGLEMGPVFQKTLQETRLELRAGETLVFFTDGFTEAMNEQRQEYGEERFIDFLQKNTHESAEEMVRNTIAEIRSFTGGNEQHDDMTIIVIKVRE